MNDKGIIGAVILPQSCRSGGEDIRVPDMAACSASGWRQKSVIIILRESRALSPLQLQSTLPGTESLKMRLGNMSKQSLDITFIEPAMISAPHIDSTLHVRGLVLRR